MQITAFENADALAMRSAQRIRDALTQKPDTLFCFAAGRTQIPTYRVLSEWSRQGQIDVTRARVIGLDDIVGANPSAGEGFRYFLNLHLFGPAGFAPENIEFFQTRAADMHKECKRIDNWLDTYGPIDFLLLGIGLNGHIGYNEPGASPAGRSFILKLEEKSTSVSGEYFDHAFDISTGITLGLSDLLQAKTILVQATGRDKAPVIQKLRAGDIDPVVPVTHLHTRRDVDVYIDREADAGL